MATHSHDFNPESSSGPPAGAASNEQFEGEIPANFSPDQPGAAAAETAVPRDWRDPNLRPLSLGGPAPGGKYEAVTSSEAQTEIRSSEEGTTDPVKSANIFGYDYVPPVRPAPPQPTAPEIFNAKMTPEEVAEAAEDIDTIRSEYAHGQSRRILIGTKLQHLKAIWDKYDRSKFKREIQQATGNAVRDQGVGGSNPLSPTISINNLRLVALQSEPHRTPRSARAAL